MIFDMYLSGMGFVRIAQKLNVLGVLTRSEYKKTGSIYKTDISYQSKGWRTNAIRRIITNKTYMGALDQRRTTTRNYKDRTRIYLDDSDHIIIHDVHEAIIDKNVFNKVQEIIKTKCTKTSRYSIKLYPLSGMLKCAECGSPMLRSPKHAKGKLYVYYKCRGYYHKGETICTHNHSIREEVIIETVVTSLNLHIQALIDVKTTINTINKSKSQVMYSIDYNKLIKCKG